MSIPRTKRAMTPTVDGLEARKLMTGDISMSSGIVHIVGDVAAYSNTLTVVYKDPSHSVMELSLFEDGKSTVSDFNSADVRLIDFTGNGKASNTFVNTTAATDKASGGDGYNFFLATGSSDNTFKGGNGTNVFLDYGNGKNDYTGGNGFNVFIVGNGDSTLTGGTGVNYVVAGSGNDTITTGGTSYVWRM